MSVPGSGKGGWEGEQGKASARPRRPVPPGPALAPVLLPGESSAEDPSTPPSLPAISAPVSAPKWLPPTNRCESIPAEPHSAPVPTVPTTPPRLPAQLGPHGASSPAAPRCHGTHQVPGGGSPLGLCGGKQHQAIAGPREQEDVQADAGRAASCSRDARGRRPAASTPGVG